MSNKPLRHIVEGIALALFVYMVSSSAVPLLLTPAHAQAPRLFSVTLIAPTGGNQVRRQYASIITSNMISLGIDAKLFYVTFPALSDRLFFSSAPQGSTFDKGGYDMGFIGWGPTSPVPDFRSNFDGRPAYLAPNGNNYALYNSPQMNSVFDQLYSTTDVQKQLQLTHAFEQILFNDAPYNYIYETVDPVPRDVKWTDYNSKNVYSEVTFPDVQHWAGGTDLTLAEANPVFPGNTLNPVVTASSNTFYAAYIYNAIMGGSLQEVDSRDLSFYLGTADRITSSADGLDWNITIKHNVLFQSGVEATADDFVWTEWAETNAQAASLDQGNNIQYLGNVVDFTFLNGTTVTLDNRVSPTEPVRHGWWKANSRYSFSFRLPVVYAFTRQVYGAITPLPKHIMEKFPLNTWDSAPFSTANGPYVYSWDTGRYGGSGSYVAVGPVGAGPYYLESFDFTRNLATMKKFPQYWNASGLQALGQFTINAYKVVWINSKDAAIASLKNGEVNVLDYNFNFQRDVDTLKSIGANIITAPELGWQEQGFNMKHPVFGTGVDTPVGRSDPSKAAEAARHVRKAISHLIPRDQIVRDLLGGSAYPLATNLGPGWGDLYDPSIKPDTYDVNTAAAELRTAGYSPTLGPEPAPIAFTGNPMLGSGSVAISGLARAPHEMLIIQQSTDGGKTWRNYAAAVSGNESRYQVSAPAPPAFGTVLYRANFTGYVLPNNLATKPITPDQVNQYINAKEYFERRLLPELDTEPIPVSSASNDAMIVGAITVVILAGVSAVVWRRRSKKPK